MNLFYREIKIGRLYIWLLVTYFFFSPLYFTIVYPGSLSGHNGIGQVFPLFLSFITLLVSLPVLWIVKYMAEKKLLLGYVFLYFVLFSSLLGFFISIGDDKLLSALPISNFIGLLITFLCFHIFSKN